MYVMYLLSSFLVFSSIAIDGMVVDGRSRRSGVVSVSDMGWTALANLLDGRRLFCLFLHLFMPGADGYRMVSIQ